MNNSNDSDKTVFMPPPASSDPNRTVIIPTPGARRPQSEARPAPSTPAPETNQAFAPMGNNEPIKLNQGLNPLSKAAATLITVSIKLSSTMQHDDIPGLHRQLGDELRRFEQQAKNASIAPEIVLSARYLLCTVLDEIVLNTPWGANCGWSQRSLLSIFHNETNGGEKCFAILQKMLQTPAQHLDMLELFYMCLSLGFEGQYKLDPRGHTQLAQIQDHLYQTIENYRGSFEPDLSTTWQSGVNKKSSLIHYIPVWVIASCVLVVMLLVYSGFRVWLYQSTTDTSARLNGLAQITEQGIPQGNTARSSKNTD